MRALSLNGQNKSAFEKNQTGSWRYDIVDQGLKVNMPDAQRLAWPRFASIRRECSPTENESSKLYQAAFVNDAWAILPPADDARRVSSCHLYMLRILGADEARRDAIIQHLSDVGIGVNVHYIPMAMLTLFKDRGYRMADYPKTYGAGSSPTRSLCRSTTPSPTSRSPK